MASRFSLSLSLLLLGFFQSLQVEAQVPPAVLLGVTAGDAISPAAGVQISPLSPGFAPLTSSSGVGAVIPIQTVPVSVSSKTGFSSSGNIGTDSGLSATVIAPSIVNTTSYLVNQSSSVGFSGQRSVSFVDMKTGDLLNPPVSGVSNVFESTLSP